MVADGFVQSFFSCFNKINMSHTWVESHPGKNLPRQLIAYNLQIFLPKFFFFHFVVKSIRYAREMSKFIVTHELASVWNDIFGMNWVWNDTYRG